MGRTRLTKLFILFALSGIVLLPGPAGAQTKAPEKIESFGYDIFRSTAGPVSEGPVDEQYVLSPGDEVIISTWGQLNLLHNLVVSEEGFIELPDEGGRIPTNGVSLKELKAKVTQALSMIYAAYINAAEPTKSTAFVDVKLGKIRKLLLYVVGEVTNPGAYTLSSGTATVVNLLLNAGGVKESGSLREIRIRRADGRIDSIDLYDFLLTGRLDVKKARLQTGDYVIVPLKKKSAVVQGEIRRPLRYELIGNEGIKELVAFAGGFTSDAFLLRTQLKRFEVNRGEVYLDINLDALYQDANRNYALIDRDELTILGNVQVRKSVVSILGDGVTRPGNYEFKPGMTLEDLINRAEGLREYVYLDRADLIRTESDFSKKLTTFSLRDLYKEVKPGVFAFAGTKEKNFALKEMDQVSIYSTFGMFGKDKYISLEGRVKEKGLFLLAKNMTLFDVVFAHGGFQDADFKRTAYLDLAHVIRKISGPIGQKIIPFNLGKLIEGDRTADFPLEEGDLIRIYANDQMTVKGNVEIAGLVNNPGQYDLSENLTVQDLIVLAGGLRADAYKVEAVIARAEGRGEGTAAEQSSIATIRVPVDPGYAILPQDKKTPLKAFDKIMVRNLPGWEPLPVVSLNGEVRFPGNYSLESREERVSSIIKRAEGLKPGALPEGATITRYRNIVTMAPGDARQFYEITLDLARGLKNPGSESDIILKNGDRIFIPTNPGTVEVKGAVRQPLILQHQAGLRFKDYIALCGGYLDTADTANIVLHAANNATRKIGRSLFSSSNPQVSPGSTIEVPYIGESTKLETVEVKGAVVKPAIIQFIKGAKLGYYLNLSGGYTKDADLDKVAVQLPDGGILAKDGNASFNPIITAGSIIIVAEKPSAESLDQALPGSEKAATLEKRLEDMEEESAKPETVEVTGAVVKPAIVPYIKGAKLGYYLNACGGLNKDADEEKISIRLPDGAMIVRQENVPFNPVVPPGSVVVVTKKEAIAK